MKTISAQAQLKQILASLDIARYRYLNPQVSYDHSPTQAEIRRRTQIAVWAYAYEIHDDPIVSDTLFDITARQIDTHIITGDDVYDRFFREEFLPNTGMWIHTFPNHDKLELYYQAWLKFTKPMTVVPKEIE